MLQAWGFDKIGVVAADLYFVDPDPAPGQEGAEHGVRLEVRLLERPPVSGSVYAAQPIVVDRPVWRADFLETVDGEAGSHDRTHHHPGFRGWEPGRRHYDEGLTADPIGWLEAQLGRLPELLARAGVDPAAAGPGDADDLAGAAPLIASAVGELLRRVRSGELGRAPDISAGTPPAVGVRAGWL